MRASVIASREYFAAQHAWARAWVKQFAKELLDIPEIKWRSNPDTVTILHPTRLHTLLNVIADCEGVAICRIGREAEYHGPGTVDARIRDLLGIILHETQ